MKFGQSLAWYRLAALLCTASLASAQAPDKGGMGGDRRPLRNGWKGPTRWGPRRSGEPTTIAWHEPIGRARWRQQRHVGACTRW